MYKLNAIWTAARLSIVIVILPCSYFSAYAQDSDDAGDSSYHVPVLPDPVPLAKPQYPASTATNVAAAISPALNSTPTPRRNTGGASCTITNPCAVNTPEGNVLAKGQ
jgi:hypothetical protein